MCTSRWGIRGLALTGASWERLLFRLKAFIRGAAAAMRYFAGLDVSAKETSICIVDDAGSIVLEAKVSTPSARISCQPFVRTVDPTPSPAREACDGISPLAGC
jgi:hypothetical protein